MNETTDEIQGHIRDRREDLNANIQELEQKVKSATDWRQHFDKSPGMFLAAALGGGLLLALVTNSRKSRVVYAAPPAAPVDIPAPQKAASHADDSLGMIKSALIGLAAGHIKDAIAQMVPGFRAEVAERESSAERPSVDAKRHPQGNGEAGQGNGRSNN